MVTKASRSPLASDYDDIYRRRLAPNIIDAIEAEVVADSTLSDLKCTGVLRTGDRERFRDLLFASLLPQSPKTVLLDLGCGTGGLSCWMADELNAELIGIDFSPTAISLASESNTKSILKNRVTFRVAQFHATGLEDGSITAVFSLDGLYLAPDISIVVRELERVMISGAPLLFTCYLERFGSVDWIPCLQNYGFDVFSVTDVTADWRNHMRIKHSARWEKRDAIRRALGEFADRELSVTKSMLGMGGAPSYIEGTYRYMIHAVRQ